MTLKSLLECWLCDNVNLVPNTLDFRGVGNKKVIHDGIFREKY